jgi:hypothetical protein
MQQDDPSRSTPISDYSEYAGIRVPVVGAGVCQYEEPSFPTSGFAKPEPCQR